MAGENRIGALWLKDKGPYAKGSIKIDGKDIKIAVWKNTRKQPGEKFPDLYVEIDTWKPAQAQAPQQPAHVEQVAAAFSDFDDDIPF